MSVSMGCLSLHIDTVQPASTESAMEGREEAMKVLAMIFRPEQVEFVSAGRSK